MTSNSRISVSANGNSVRTATPFLIQAPMDSKQLYQLTASLLAQREEKEKAKETYSYRVKIINQKKKTTSKRGDCSIVIDFPPFII